MLDQRRIILQYFYAYVAYCDSFSKTMAYVMVYFHYVVLIAYLLIGFSLVILEPYEAVMSLAESEVAFMNRDVHVFQTFIHNQVPV